MKFRALLFVIACAGCIDGEDDLAPSDDVVTDDLPPTDDLGEPPTEITPAMPAAMCDAAHPVKLVIDMTGHDGNSVHATVGIDLARGNTSVDRNGALDDKASYPIVLNYNPSYDFAGQPKGTPGEVRSWTGCVSAKVDRVYIEAYPRDATGKTNRTKYGSTVYQYVAVSGPGTYHVNLRFPVVTEWALANGLPGGDTGNIFGHVMCHGAPAVPDHLKLRVWSAQPGSACGIRAYSAAAEPSDQPTYTFKALAGGQCHAAYQQVAAYIRGNCDGRYMEVKKLVNVTTGKTLPLNIELSTGIDRGGARTY